MRKLRRVLAAVSVAALAGCSGASSAGMAWRYPTTIFKPAQPPTARQVAGRVGVTGFTDCGAGDVYVTDSGVGQYRGVRVGIDTFASHAGLTDWLQSAEIFGVVPWLESDTWVLYKSVHPENVGCSS